MILIGNAGISEGVVAETVRALHDHELIKVRLPGLPREERDAALVDLAARTESELVVRIGHIAALYRARKDMPRVILPA